MGDSGSGVKCEDLRWRPSPPSEAEIKECLPNPACKPEGGTFSYPFSAEKNRREAEGCALKLRAMGYEADTSVVSRWPWANAARVTVWGSATEREIAGRLQTIERLIPLFQKLDAAQDVKRLEEIRGFFVNQRAIITGAAKDRSSVERAAHTYKGASLPFENTLGRIEAKIELPKGLGNLVQALERLRGSSRTHWDQSGRLESFLQTLRGLNNEIEQMPFQERAPAIALFVRKNMGVFGTILTELGSWAPASGDSARRDSDQVEEGIGRLVVIQSSIE